MRKPKILVVDDNEELCKQIVDYHKKVYDITYCTTTEKFEELVSNEDFELLIIDLVLDEVNGLEIYKKISKYYDITTIFISGKAGLDERIEGLKLGAEDFITKPFELEEFKLKIQRILGRTSRKNVIGDYQIDEDTHQVTYKGRRLNLAPAPYRLLIYLLKNPNKDLSRELLMNKVWNFEVDFGDRVVDTNINLLRKETQDGRIKSVWGIGYRYDLY